METIIQRLEYDRYGGPEIIKLRSFEQRRPNAQEVVVRVEAASINPMDWKIRNGSMKMITGIKFPRALGTDFAGIIESVGSDVSEFERGDAVVGTVPMKASGAFASSLVTNETLVVKKPDRVSFIDAAALPIAGVTAWNALVTTAHIEAGQTVFINGAMGAVGQAAIAIARAIGAEVVGRVGSRSIEQARSRGLTQILDYTQPVPSSLNGMFDIVFDAHGSLSVTDGDRLMRRGGVVIDIAPTPWKFLNAFVRRSRRFVFANAAAKNLQHVVDLAASGKLSITVAETVSLADAPRALAALEHGTRPSGKIVIAF